MKDQLYNDVKYTLHFSVQGGTLRHWSVKYSLHHSDQGGTLAHIDVKYVWGGCNGKWKDVKYI